MEARLKTRLFSLLIAACLAPSAHRALANEPSAQATTPAQTAAALTAEVDELFAQWDKPDSPGCALGVIKDGQIIYKRGYGMANLEYAIPNTPTTRLHVASVSKQFTAMAVVLLSLEGKLALDDDLRKYIPELPDFGKTITPRHLLHHTSGLREQWDILQFAGWRMEDIITLRDALEMTWKQRELNFDPGERYLYCNTGYMLLALLVERASGQTLTEYCRDKIFQPLGMRDSHFHDDYQMPLRNRAYSYDPKPGGGFQHNVVIFAITGATSLFTTIEDLALWDQNFYNPVVGGKPALDLMHRKGKLNDGKEIDYAAGLGISAYRGLPTVMHTGSRAGFRSVILRFPEQRFSVIILANLGSIVPANLARKVADLYLADQLQPVSAPARTQPTATPSASLTPDSYDDYAGTYWMADGTTKTFTKDQDRLLVRTGGAKVPLQEAAPAQFIEERSTTRYAFSKTPNARVRQVQVQIGEQAPTAGKKIEISPLPPSQLSQYAGDYYSIELETAYKLHIEAGRLMLRHRKDQEPLVPIGDDEFLTYFDRDGRESHNYMFVRFTRDTQKAVSGFTIDCNRVKHLRFGRIELPKTELPKRELPTPANLTAEVDKLFARWDKLDSPGCALAIVKDGQIIYKRGYGLANIEYAVPITPTTVFHVASVSKQFTAMAAMMLAHEGKLSLDDDLRKYIPEFPDFGKTITPRHLILHTSGLRDQWELLQFAGWRMEDSITQRDVLEILWPQRELNFAPGEQHLYCNSGYTLLALLVERISGQTFAEYCRANIFQPLGMLNTHFHDDYKRIVPNRAYSYDVKRDGGFKHNVLSFGTVGATSLFTTVEDLARWDQNFYDAKVGGRAVIEEMVRKGKLNNGQEIDYAGGLTIGTHRGLPTVSHGGLDAGFRSVLLQFPYQRFTVIILANLGRVAPGNLAKEIADLYLADQMQPATAPASPRRMRSAEPARPATAPSASIGSNHYADYAGRYWMADGSARTFAQAEGKLALSFGDFRLPLQELAAGQFLDDRSSTRYTFVRDAAGKVRQVQRQTGSEAPTTGRRFDDSMPPSQMQPYVGDFYSTELCAIYNIFVQDGQLMFRHRKDCQPLVSLGNEDFLTHFDAPSRDYGDYTAVHFIKDAQGAVTGFTITNGRVKNLRFGRITLPK